MAQSTIIPVGVEHEDGQHLAAAARPRRLLIVGATGNTGRQMLNQALAAGHDVVALVRDPARLAVEHPHLRVLRGDVRDASSLVPVMADRDAVLSSLGTAGRAPTTLYSEGMRNIVQAMKPAGVKRIIAVSASPVEIDKGDTLPARLLMKPLLRAILKEPYADMARMEEVLRTADLDWTIVRPPRLLDKAPTGRYRTALNMSVRRGYAIARADLAHAMLTFLDDPAAVHATIGIGY